LVRDQEIGGSNPLSPTLRKPFGITEWLSL
jgi:hypothetical protein